MVECQSQPQVKKVTVITEQTPATNTVSVSNQESSFQSCSGHTFLPKL